MTSKTFNVDVCETRKRTIQIKAASQEEAHQLAQERWALGHVLLSDTEVTDIHFTAYPIRRNRLLER